MKMICSILRLKVFNLSGGVWAFAGQRGWCISGRAQIRRPRWASVWKLVLP